jgi:hypothetical protein
MNIFAAIILGLVVLTIVYAVARRLRGLDDDEMEPAGSDGRAITRKD